MKDLYYILMYNNLGNVKECKTLIKHGLIQVNGVVETNCKRKIQEEDVLIYQGKMLKSQPFHYLMLNKPQGYLCANKDEKEKCVVDLIDYPDCFCLGRLDRDTTGLLILTNDKKLNLLEKHQKRLEIIDDFHGYVTIEEGKYHQIKKMFLSLKNEVVSLKRISFDEILLDENLSEGMSRPLNKEERNKLIKKRLNIESLKLFLSLK